MEEVILESRSPVCRLDAVVSRERDSYYFYIMRTPEHMCELVHRCWICNRKPAPDEITEASFEGGAPMLPKRNVGPEHKPAGMDLDADRLSIVWYRSGDTAALLCDDEIICVIPPVAGKYDFPGYSKFAAGQHRYAWALPASTRKMKAEIDENRKYWKYISENHWPESRERHLAVLNGFFDRTSKSLDTDQGRFPYRSLVQGVKNDVVYNFTVGVSRFPMPKSAIHFGNSYEESCYIELGFACSQKHAALADLMGSVMAQIADMPWQELNILWHGHTVDFPNIRGCSALLFINPDMVPGLEKPDYSASKKKINLLWIVPVTEEEMKTIRSEGINKAVSHVHFPERLHIFDGQTKFI